VRRQLVGTDPDGKIIHHRSRETLPPVPAEVFDHAAKALQADLAGPSLDVMKRDSAEPPKKTPPKKWNRRECLASLGAAAAASLSGCIASAGGGVPDLVWGRRGFSNGRFIKPRCVAIDSADRLYVCDTTGRIQVFDADGNFQRVWSTPDTANGRPTGLQVRAGDESIDREVLLVADTHYYRMLAFELDGTPIPDLTIGGTAGFGRGEFAFVTEAVCDDEGCFYVGEYGDSDRIQKFDPKGTFISQCGGTGAEPGQFVRPQSMIVHRNVLYVTDAGNHRVQAFDVSGSQFRRIDLWGTQGSLPGQLYYPYDVTLIGGEGGGPPDLLICEYANQRVQRLTLSGDPVALLGSPGFEDGQFYQPWGVVVDSRGRIHVLDSNNHRIQRFATI